MNEDMTYYIIYPRYTDIVPIITCTLEQALIQFNEMKSNHQSVCIVKCKLNEIENEVILESE